MGFRIIINKNRKFKKLENHLKMLINFNKNINSTVNNNYFKTYLNV